MEIKYDVNNLKKKKNQLQETIFTRNIQIKSNQAFFRKVKVITGWIGKEN